MVELAYSGRKGNNMLKKGQTAMEYVILVASAILLVTGVTYVIKTVVLSG